MTRADLLAQLQERGVDRVYGRALSRCLKDELESYLRTFTREEGRYYSYSQVNMFLRCGLQYYYRYMRGMKRPPSGALTVGICYDTALNRNYEAKMVTGEDLPESELTDTYYERFLVQKPITDWKDEKPQEAETRGLELVRVARKELTPLVKQVVAVQKDIYVGFENEPYFFRVILDLIEDLVGGGYGIIDNKSTKKKMNQDDVDKDLQLTAQSFAFRQEYEMEEADLGLDVAISLKKGAKIDRPRTKRGPLDHIRLLRMVAHVVDGIRKRVFLPADQGSWVCSPKWCGYWDTCHKEF